ncbi:MAG: molybdate ABC transporter substrate-binding protein [Oceanococcaceae bacterium]
MGKARLWLLFLGLGALSAPTWAAPLPLHVAVASNFHAPLKAVQSSLEAQLGQPLRFSAGSSGTLYAQILQGAPFDLLLAADTARPQALLAAGQALQDSYRVYAHGRLVLLHPGRQASEPLQDWLGAQAAGRLAMANPRHAPYGQAAQSLLEGWDLWDQWQTRVVLGENVAQSFHFVRSGHAQWGLVALSQLRLAQRQGLEGLEHSLIPTAEHPPIAQAGVVLRRSLQPQAAQRVLLLLGQPPIREQLQSDGYLIPESLH